MTRRVLATAAVCAALAGLTGCSAPATSTDGTASTLTIADSKGPAQLLRNTAVAEIPKGDVAEVGEAEDATIPCRTAEKDPDELERAWKSTARIELTPSSDADAIVEDIVESFVASGWDRGIYGSASIIRLTREDTRAAVHLSVNNGGEDGEGAKVQVNVTGPCVMTLGPESDEVKSAEGRLDEDE